jgi:hypothetical protein
MASISRISKLLVDRNGDDPGKVLARRREFTVTIKLGDDVAASRSLQLAALTAVRLAARCFPGAVRVDAPDPVLSAPALVGAPGRATLGFALAREVGNRNMTVTDGDRLVLFGNAAHDGAATRVTFDGWAAVTGPHHVLSRYAEREHCSLAPILAAALAISEIFLGFAGIDLLAGRRVVGLSLWRPDLGHAHPEAVGPVVTALPKQAWLLGLGHLGNAYLWALATLPFADPTDVLLYLLDFDKVEKPNTETGVLFRSRDIGELKTRVCSNWLEQFGIKTRLIERRFEEHMRRLDGEPALALSGFDNNEARQLLVGAKFGRVIDSGLGGTATNFDSISLRTWPNASAAYDIWPVLSKRQKEEAEESIMKTAKENPGYRRLKRDHCGLVEYAGKLVAVPFVGMAAATLVMADTLRVLNGGERLENLKVRLGSLSGELAVTWSKYSRDDLAAVAYAPAVKH